MKSKIVYILSGYIFLLSLASTWAQQDPNYTLYRYNMNLVNPAFAGAHEGSELGFNIRSQWAGVAGAPETQSVFFGTPVGRNLGLGVSIINDRTFIESQTSISVDVSYKVKLDLNTDLYFGIKAGANSYNVNTTGITTFGIGADPSLNNLDGSFSPNIGAGVYLKANDYFITFSIPRLLTPDRLETLNGQVQLGRNRIHTYFSTGYDFTIGKEVVFKPSIQLRYINAAPLSIDLTAAFELSDRFEFGANYRLNEGIGGFGIFNLASWVDVGYLYESAFENPISLGSGGTHEVYMKLRL